jgi:hypothetical protein
MEAILEPRPASGNGKHRVIRPGYRGAPASAAGSSERSRTPSLR